jgi:DnaJ-class molecular chaperone
MIYCDRCKTAEKCARCGGSGLVKVEYRSGLTVHAACEHCWGTGLEHDPERHPDPDEPRSSGWAGADR